MEKPQGASGGAPETREEIQAYLRDLEQRIRDEMKGLLSPQGRITDAEAYLDVVKKGSAFKFSKMGMEESRNFRYRCDNEFFQAFLKEKLRPGEKTQVLIIGVGDHQESLSFTANAYEFITGEDFMGQHGVHGLSDLLSLHIVDLRPKDEIRMSSRCPEAEVDKEWLAHGYTTTFSNFPLLPLLFQRSLVEAPGIEKPEIHFHPEVVRFVDEAANGSNANWLTPVENFALEHEGVFDLVLCNSVFPYLGGYAPPYQVYTSPKTSRGPFDGMEEEHPVFTSTVQNIFLMAKPGGRVMVHQDSTRRFDYWADAASDMIAALPLSKTGMLAKETVAVWKRRG